MVDVGLHARPVQPPFGKLPGTADSAFRLPALHCPFPVAPCHPDAEALIERALGWTSAFGLLPDEPGAAAKVRSYSMLAARCYPTAAFDRLATIGDYYSWLFFFDDACENLSLEGASPADVRAFLCQIYAAIGIRCEQLEGRRGDVASLFIRALNDIWERISRTTCSLWRNRFMLHVANYIDGCVWEASRLTSRLNICFYAIKYSQICSALASALATSPAWPVEAIARMLWNGAVGVPVLSHADAPGRAGWDPNSCTGDRDARVPVSGAVRPDDHCAQ